MSSAAPRGEFVSPDTIAGSLVAMALAIAATGVPVFPCTGEKKPVVAKGFYAATTDPAVIRAAFGSPRAKLIGTPTGGNTGFDALDLDPRHGSDAWRTENIHRMPETRIHRTGGGGEHWLFQHHKGVRNIQDGKTIAPGVDVRGQGGYVIHPPSDGYIVISDADIAPWPAWLLELVLPKPKVDRPKAAAQTSTDQLDVRYRGYVQKLLDTLRIAPDGTKHDTLLKQGRTLGGIRVAAGISEADAYAMLMGCLPDHCQDNAGPTAMDALENGANEPFDLEDRPNPSNGKHHHAPPRFKSNVTNDSDEAPDDEQPDAEEASDPGMPIEFSENALAYEFTNAHAADLLYVPQWGKWIRWDAGRWREDFTVQVYDSAREITARAGEKAIATIPKGGKKIATIINRAATVAAIERLCRHHHRHVRPDDVFDADRRMINTPAEEIKMHGIVARRPHQREDYMTRMANVSAAPRGTDCPIWRKFLLRTMGEDQTMVDYLQRVCGYMLTGSVQEHVLFFGYGTGANGKSTFASVLLGILASGQYGYAAVAPISTFTAAKNEQHPTDLAMLRGVRCVIAQETEEGRAWAVSKLKMMTGGDPISARFMRQDFFTYEPQFKLLILGNHKPALQAVDEALRRRFHLIPFTVTIPADERDPELSEKLKAEYPAIFAWMIEGCVAWQKDGLSPPAKVIEATKNYLIDEDSLAAWIAEACLVDRKYASTPLIELFASWKTWAEANGERVGQRKELAKALDARPELTRREQPVTKRAAWDGIVVKPILGSDRGPD